MGDLLVTYAEARRYLFAKVSALSAQPPVYWPRWTLDDFTALVVVLYTTEEP
jgi:hypothetical protein